MINKFILALVVIALMTLGCSITIDLPGTDYKTGPTRTEDIMVPFLENRADTADVTIAFGAGRLNIESGGTEALLTGTARFNVADIRPELTIDDNVIRLEQGNLDFDGIPSFSNDFENQWDLIFGDAPMELVINAGAYSGRFELGGLSLERLEINDGAAEVNVNFSQPNLAVMSYFEYSTGASTISLQGLANANCEDLVFKGGVGSYTLDFSGELMRDMVVDIESGASSITIIVPEGTAAVLNSTGGLMSVNVNGSWDQDGSRYTVEGEGFTITFHVDLGAGSLSLETR